MAAGDRRRTERLDGELVRRLEEVARRLGADDGVWTLDLMFENGRFRKAHRHHGPITRTEIPGLDRLRSTG